VTVDAIFVEYQASLARVTLRRHCGWEGDDFDCVVVHWRRKVGKDCIDGVLLSECTSPMVSVFENME